MRLISVGDHVVNPIYIASIHQRTTNITHVTLINGKQINTSESAKHLQERLEQELNRLDA